MIKRTPDGYLLTGKDANQFTQLCELIRNNIWNDSDEARFESFADDVLSAEQVHNSI